jgi:hypothetical protein
MERMIIGYLLDTAHYQLLRSLEKALYGDGSALTPDKRRDLANLLNLVMSRLEPVLEEKKSNG